jgi:uncharacterized membrane protein YhhN
MPMLIVYVIAEMNGNVKPVLLLLLALLFSWAGDIFLLNSSTEMYFMLGLAAFLCAHVAYIFAFRKLSNKTEKRKINFLLWLPFIVFAVFLFIIIYPSLEDMLIPVLIYAVAITAMGIAAALRRGKTNHYSFIVVLSGAISFILSDSLIAINRFYNAFDNASLCIMLAYIIAQYNIAAGCLSHLRQ